MTEDYMLMQAPIAVFSAAKHEAIVPVYAKADYQNYTNRHLITCSLTKHLRPW